MLENIIEEIERVPDDRLEALIGRAFAANSDLESSVRAWATADPQARAAVEAVDVERIRYLRKLLIETGVGPSVAEARARVMNWCYLGYVLSANELDDKSLMLVIRDLTQLARLKVQEFPLAARAPLAAARPSRRRARP
jgi:hypothetical protein